MDLASVLKLIIEIVYPGLLAAFGATAKYVHTIVTQRVTFMWLFFFGNLFIAFFVGVLINSFLEPDFRFRDGIFMLCGMVAIKIFSMGERVFESVAGRFAQNISNKWGGNPGPPTNDRKQSNDDH